MKVFVVYCHPSKDSFTYGVKENFIKGLQDAGHEVTVSDLYAMKFNPVISEDEYSREAFYDESKPVPQDVLDEQKKINDCDMIAFVYPDFWTASPAMLEGWFQRVLTYGFAYGDHPKMKQLDKALFLVTMGGSLKEEIRKKQLASMKTVMIGDRINTRAKESRMIVFDEMSRDKAYAGHRESMKNENFEKAYNYGVNLGEESIEDMAAGEDFAAYEIANIDENTWRIENIFVRCFLLIGKEKALLIDSGSTLPNVREIAEKITHLPIMLINTHGDGDHTSGNGAFEEYYISEEDYTGCGMKEKFPESKALFVKDGQIIDLGGRILKIIATPGHTFGSISILDVTNRSIYTGDSVQNGIIYMFGEKRCPGKYGESLKKLIEMQSEYDTIYASHSQFALEADYAGKVLNEWEKVGRGEVEARIENLFGNEVKVYECGCCGFYLQ